ncbi:hypothetical protein CK203_086051 [Vitis vinifera]|uniref:Uncharacterized protein n=1 Tax=Vitis vinifera TaxID=29760 RepID=A0A438D546_VITVI|nr:hypothetical protein CK203_086051 [Vitis vinifera]
MSGSNVEETSEQTRGRETEPTARGRGRGKKDTSRDVVANMEARLAKVELAMADTREGVDLIEQGMEKGLEDLREQIQDLREGYWSRKFSRCHTRTRVIATHEAPRVEVPKPHTFSGKRDAKELDNFLWHMERYFEAIALTDEATKRNQEAILSEDVAYLARKSLKRLKHTGSIREYVKEFSTLMLEIPNMAEEELLFNFMDNLQSWAEQELRRRGVQDLATAMAVAESLVDYRRGDSSKPKPPSKGNQAKGGGDKRSQGHTSKEGSSKGPSGKDGKGKDKRKEFTPRTNCFLCDGPHWARDCLKRKALNAMIEERSKKAMLRWDRCSS